MDSQAQLQVARSSRKRAEHYLNTGKSGRAFSHLLVALKLNPVWKGELKHLFALTLCTWGRTLESRGRYDDLFACYEQAVDVFGENEEVLNNLGAHLFRIGHLNEAACFFHKALNLSTSFLPALRNLESVHNTLVERWHFRMLNDGLRNEAYREAILKKVKQGFSTVLDIGTGTGVLSLFAVEAGAKEIYACDCSETMIKIANEVMDANNVHDRVIFINKMSNDLTIPTDIPHRVSLVVTETLDAGLLGENILQSLTHAWSSLLLPVHQSTDLGDNGIRNNRTRQHALVIPFGADVWMAGIECSHIAFKYRLMQNEGRVMDSSAENQSSGCLDFSKMHLVALDDEPYDTQDLKRVPGGFRFLTSATKALHINFNDPSRMMEYLNGKVEGQSLTIQCVASGQLDAFVAWFRLQLDEDIVLTSSPEDSRDAASCWDQAVFPLQHPINVGEDQQIQIKVSCSGGRLSVEVDPAAQVKDVKCGGMEAQSDGIAGTFVVQENMSTLKIRDMEGIKPCSEMMDSTGNNNVHKMASSDEDLASLVRQQLSTQPRDLSCLSVSQDIITFLNDKPMMAALNEASSFLRVDQKVTPACSILDLSPFPLLGLNLLNCTANAETSTNRWNRLTCVVKDSHDEDAVRHIAGVNGIDCARIQCIREDILEESLDSVTQFDLILVHLVDSSGKLKERYVNNLPRFKKLLKSDGLLLPQWLSIRCQLIHSNWLAEVSSALGRERVCGYKVAEYINAYQVSEHQDFSLSSLQHITSSNIAEILVTTCEVLAGTLETQLTVEVLVPVTNTGPVNAIPYWFELKLLNNSMSVSTLRMDSYANQTSVLIQPEMLLERGTTASVILKCFQGLIDLQLKE